MTINYTAIAPTAWRLPNLTGDPRHFQIAVLAALLVLQVGRFDLGATPLQAALTIGTALAVQLAMAWLTGAAFDCRSPLITGLSSSLLLRTQEPLLWMAAPLLAIGSKRVLRWRDKHFFNPATFAIVFLLLVSPDVWVSPGQWGHSVWLVLLFVCGGGMVLQRAERIDTALAFLACYAGLLFGRAWLLGDPMAIPLNQLESGAVLLFSFFMITDPRSTPDRRLGRILFAAAVAGVAYWLQFEWQVRPAMYFALAAVSPATPLIDWLLPADRFTWRRAAVSRD